MQTSPQQADVDVWVATGGAATASAPLNPSDNSQRPSVSAETASVPVRSIRAVKGEGELTSRTQSGANALCAVAGIVLSDPEN